MTALIDDQVVVELGAGMRDRKVIIGLEAEARAGEAAVGIKLALVCEKGAALGAETEAASMSELDS